MTSSVARRPRDARGRDAARRARASAPRPTTPSRREAVRDQRSLAGRPGQGERFRRSVLPRVSRQTHSSGLFPRRRARVKRRPRAAATHSRGRRARLSLEKHAEFVRVILKTPHGGRRRARASTRGARPRASSTRARDGRRRTRRGARAHVRAASLRRRRGAGGDAPLERASMASREPLRGAVRVPGRA
eukprot:31176-Pelagococcus_subviridis.AAC.3